MIINVRNCLIDLSLNFKNISFLEHSSFFDLTGSNCTDVNEFEDESFDRGTIFDFTNIDISNLSLSKTNTMTESTNERMINQPSFIFYMTVIQEMLDFFDKYLINSENYLENIEYWLD